MIIKIRVIFTTIINAKLQAIFNDLSLAWLEGIPSLICESDSISHQHDSR